MLPLPASNLPFFTDEETETGARNWGERDKDKGTDTKGFRARLQERACGHRLEGRSEKGKESTLPRLPGGTGHFLRRGEASEWWLRRASQRRQVDIGSLLTKGDHLRIRKSRRGGQPRSKPCVQRHRGTRQESVQHVQELG